MLGSEFLQKPSHDLAVYQVGDRGVATAARSTLRPELCVWSGTLIAILGRSEYSGDAFDAQYLSALRRKM
jgi:hypothetical protein